MAEQNGAAPQDRGRLYSTPLDTATVQPVPLEMLEALASTWDEEEERERKVRGRGQGQGRVSGDGGGGTASASASVSANGRLTADVVLPEGFNRNRVYERARRYLARVDPAVSGQRGHDATYRAACVLVVRFNLSVSEAFPLLAEWNARCDPPWEEAELARKLREADEKETGPRGEYLRGLLREARRGQQQRDTAPDQPTGEPVDPQPSQAGLQQPEPFQNYFETERREGDRMRRVTVGYPLCHLGEELLRRTNGWPKRVGDLLFAAQDHRPLWLKSSSALFAWITRQMPALFDHENHPMNNVVWADGDDKATPGQFFDYLRQTAEEYDAAERYPHEPPIAGHCYLNPPLPHSDGSALRHFLEMFAPASDVDAQLVKAFFLTLFWGGLPGQRPAWLFTAPDEDTNTGRGAGKSTVPQIGSQLVGGYIGLSSNEPIGEIQRRLLSPPALESRVVLLDNIKSLRFSWGELEALITDRCISGRQMWVGEGRRPNTLTWVLTFNGASMSRDMAQRSIIVKVARPRYKARWVADVNRLIDERRWEIISDIITELQRDVPELDVQSRWAAWEQAILARVDDPAACQKQIRERQGVADDDQEEMQLIRAALYEFVRNCTENVDPPGETNPDYKRVLISSRMAAEVINDATGERRPTGRAMIHLYSLGISEITRNPDHHQRGCVWTGSLYGTRTRPTQQADPELDYDIGVQ